MKDPTRRFRVEVLRSEDEDGHQEWVIAARRGPAMDNGPAEAIDAQEAMELVISLFATGSLARIVALPDEGV